MSRPCSRIGRVALGRVAVFFADDALELAEAHAVRVGQVRLRVEQLALLKRRPEPRVAHDDHIDDTVRVEGELILADERRSSWGGRPCPSAASSSPDSTFMKVDLPDPLGPVSP